jgi:hypothetical protein
MEVKTGGLDAAFEIVSQGNLRREGSVFLLGDGFLPDLVLNRRGQVAPLGPGP